MRPSTKRHLENLAKKPGDSLTAIFYGNTNSDSEFTIEIMDKSGAIKSHNVLYRSETGIMLRYDPSAIESVMVDNCLQHVPRSRALCVPTTGSAIFHVAAAMIKQGYTCLLRGDAGQ